MARSSTLLALPLRMTLRLGSQESQRRGCETEMTHCGRQIKVKEANISDNEAESTLKMFCFFLISSPKSIDFADHVRAGAG
jgi:hypothetical protein